MGHSNKIVFSSQNCSNSLWQAIRAVFGASINEGKKRLAVSNIQRQDNSAKGMTWQGFSRLNAVLLCALLWSIPFEALAQTPKEKKATTTSKSSVSKKKDSTSKAKSAPAKTTATKPATPKKTTAKPAKSSGASPKNSKPSRKNSKPSKKSEKRISKTAPKKAVSTKSSAPVVADTKQIRQLKGDRQALKRQINEAEQILKTTKSDVRSQLNTLTVLNTQIGQQRQYVDGIITEVNQLSNDIGHLTRQLDTLRRDLTYRKNKYAKSVQYMHRNRMTQSNILFVLSARSFREMRRRLRYVRAFAKYQREQGEIIRQRELLVREREAQLRGVKFEKDKLLQEGRTEQGRLEVQQAERQKVVASLQAKEAELQRTIATQRAKAAALDAKIDQMVQAEIAKAEARRREEERKRKADEARRKEEEKKRRAAAEAKRLKEEADRKRAEEAKKRQEAERAKQAADRAKAEGRQKEADRQRQEAKRLEREANQAKADKQRAEQAERKAQQEERQISTTKYTYVEADNSDRQLSHSFASNRGRLPAPISGSYAITSRFGSYAVEGLRGVQLDNKGVNLTSRGPASARAVFNGEVSTIFFHGGMYNIIVRHGSYMTVYCNLSSVSVGRGQKVSTGQTLGAVASDGNGGYTLHFELRQEMSKLNPEGWFR